MPPEDLSVKVLLYDNPNLDESDNHKILETSIYFYSQTDIVEVFYSLLWHSFAIVCSNIKNSH